VTDQGASIETRSLSWSRAAIGAAVFFGLMILFLVVVPNLLVGSDPSQAVKVLAVVYVVAAFAVVAWMIAVWQNRVQAPSVPDSGRTSAFGRPMRQGPGFASFERRLPSSGSSQTSTSGASDPGDGTSSFGRPMKKGA